MLVWILGIATFVLFAVQISMQFTDMRKNIREGRATNAQLNASVYGTTEHTIKDVLRRFPNDVEPMLRWIDIAYEDGRYDEAVIRAEAARRKFPRQPAVYEFGAQALRAAGRIADSEALIATAIKKLGKLRSLVNCQAQIAYNSGDWALAATRFAELRRLYPNEKDGYVWGAETVARLGRHEEAESLLAHLIEGPLQNRGEVELIRFAEYARQREDWSEAVRRWELLRQHFPFNCEGYLGHSEALRRSGEWTKATSVMQSAMTFCPNDPRVDVEARFVEVRDGSSSLPPDIAHTRSPPAEHSPEGNPVAGPAVDSAAQEIATHMAAAATALGDGDIDQAQVCWALARQSPTAPVDAWCLAAQHADPDQSYELLREAAERFPLAGAAQHDLARAAERRSDWLTAERGWRGFVAAEPDTWWGFAELAITLRRQGRFDAADAVLTDGSQRLPDEPILPIQRAQYAQQAADWQTARVLWDEVATKWPDRPEGVVGRAISLWHLGQSEAPAALMAAAAQFPHLAEPSEYLARLAEQQASWSEAASRWQAVVTAQPETWWAYDRLAAALLKQEKIDEADSVLSDATARFSDNAFLAGQYARLAERRGELEAAAQRWQGVIERFPTEWIGYRGRATALSNLGRTEEAQALLQDAVTRFPENADALHDVAQLAARRGDLAGAEAAWRDFLSKTGPNLLASIDLAKVLQLQGRTADCDVVLQEAMERFPNEPSAFVEYAGMAHGRGDLAEEAARWELVRDAFPTNLDGYTRGAAALRDLRRYDEAEALLQSAASRFPQEIVPVIELAFLSHRRRDLDEALRRWAILRDRAPENVMGYTFAALDLRYLGRFDEADRLLSETIARFPDEASPLIDAAMLCHERQDWREAVSRWEIVRQRFPDQLAAYTFAAIAAREDQNTALADKLLQTAMERFPDEATPAIDFARIAQHRQDWPQALERWAVVRARFPDNPEGYLSAAATLRTLTRSAEAEALLAEGEARIPTLAAIPVERAWLPFHRHEWDVAASRFEAIRARFPDEPAGYIGGAAVLTSQGQLAAAEQLLSAGMARLPGNPNLALEHAQLPVVGFLLEKRDFPEAIRRCEQMCDRFPEFEGGHLLAVRILRDANRLESAEALAADAGRRMPKSSELATEYARMALARADWEEAVARFRHAMDRFPGAVDAYVGLSEALSRLDRFDEAEAVLQTAMQRFPTNVQPFAEFAQLASRRNALKLALERWIAARERFPHDQMLASRIFEARLRLTETGSQAEMAEAEAARPTSDDAEKQPLRELILDFESLGGTLLGCEFGIVQRALGAEPLGLLRWSDMSIDDITNALRARFDGVGLPENTALIVPEVDGRAEYTLQDRRFGMTTHTFIARDDAPADKLFGQLCRRQQYLKGKLIDDLGSNSKIFVYKITARNLTADELTSLHAAMREFGENTLLYVRYSDAQHPSGTVEIAAPGLMIGYIDHFARGRNGEALAPATVAWTTICQNAHRLWQSGATA